jgi:hypothetical protein
MPKHSAKYRKQKGILFPNKAAGTRRKYASGFETEIKLLQSPTTCYPVPHISTLYPYSTAGDPQNTSYNTMLYPFTDRNCHTPCLLRIFPPRAYHKNHLAEGDLWRRIHHFRRYAYLSSAQHTSSCIISFGCVFLYFLTTWKKKNPCNYSKT